MDVAGINLVNRPARVQERRLPSPLGPIKPTASSDWTSRSASRRTWRPRKSSVLSMGGERRCCRSTARPPRRRSNTRRAGGRMCARACTCTQDPSPRRDTSHSIGTPHSLARRRTPHSQMTGRPSDSRYLSKFPLPWEWQESRAGKRPARQRPGAARADKLHFRTCQQCT
jgi:hypothetical protein